MEKITNYFFKSPCGNYVIFRVKGGEWIVLGMNGAFLFGPNSFENCECFINNM